MPRWLYRLHRSRRARNASFAAISIVSLGSCAGAVLANYTVAGMNVRPYAQQYAQTTSEAEPAWVREAAIAATGGRDFSSTERDAYSDTDY